MTKAMKIIAAMSLLVTSAAAQNVSRATQVPIGSQPPLLVKEVPTVCHICENPLLNVTFPDAVIENRTCAEIWQDGILSVLSYANCTRLQELALEECGCAPPPGQILDPTTGGEALCWNDLTELDLHEINNVLDFEVPRKYVLCPNTDYIIGFQTKAGTFRDGMRPLFPASNQHIQCGQDGRPSNNCRLRSGAFQLAVVDIGNFDALTNITIQGITFRGSFQVSAFLAYPGSIKFIDCIFQNQRNLGVIVGQVPLPLFRESDDESLQSEQRTVVEGDSDGRRRRLTWDEMDRFRKMQTDDLGNFDAATTNETLRPEMAQVSTAAPDGDETLFGIEFADELKLFVEFHFCIFQNNKLGTVRPGIITMTGPLSPIVVNQCIFLDNDYSGVERSWAINTDSALNITNSCFTNSEFVESIIRVNLAVGVTGFHAENNTVVDDQPKCDILFFLRNSDDEGVCERFPSPSDVCVATLKPGTPTVDPGIIAAPSTSASDRIAPFWIALSSAIFIMVKLW